MRPVRKNVIVSVAADVDAERDRLSVQRAAHNDDARAVFGFVLEEKLLARYTAAVRVIAIYDHGKLCFVRFSFVLDDSPLAGHAVRDDGVHVLGFRFGIAVVVLRLLRLPELDIRVRAVAGVCAEEEFALPPVLFGLRLIGAAHAVSAAVRDEDAGDGIVLFRFVAVGFGAEEYLVVIQLIRVVSAEQIHARDAHTEPVPLRRRDALARDAAPAEQTFDEGKVFVEDLHLRRVRVCGGNGINLRRGDGRVRRDGVRG